MSKILQAMQKSGFAGPELDRKLESLGAVDLYPLPAPGQRQEFERLANSLLSRCGPEGGLIVGFAGTVSGEGASYVSLNAARYLSAMIDRKVAWIDADFRSSHTRVLGRGLGFSEMLVDPDDFLRSYPENNLVLIPNGNAKVKAADLARSPTYPRLLSEFRSRFFCTIMDLSPVIESVDVVHLAEPIDGLILVIESGRLKHEVISHGVATLAEHGVNVLGTVLNKRSLAIPRSIYDRL